MTAQREAMTTLSVASPLQIEHPHRADLIGRRAGPSIRGSLGQGLGSQNPVIFGRQMGQNRRAGRPCAA